MKSSEGQSHHHTSFTLNIIFVLLIIVGAAMIPLLSLQLNPTRYLPSLTISYSWPDAPARTVEQQVTSVLEGVLTTIPGVKHISSSTYNGYGVISVEFDKKADLRTKRFEVASLVREAHERLPERVSFPLVSMNMPSNTEGSEILSYQVTGNNPPSLIFGFAEEELKPAIASVNGVYSVNIFGATRRTWEITYNHNLLEVLNIDPSTVTAAIQRYLDEREAGGGVENTGEGELHRTYLTLTGNNADSIRWEDIPVAKTAGKIVKLTEVAEIKLTDEKPDSYYRVNGLNTVTISVSAGKNVNNIRVADDVKDIVKEVRKKNSQVSDIILAVDRTDFIREEISKNVLRAVLSVVLLLCFVFLISRELKYLFIITVSLVANILIAFIFYYLFRLEMHLYSLAGITVSFGIIINNTIVMTDHLRYHKNRKVGLSLLAATLTTVGALTVIFFLDEASKVSLTDFAAVIMINLMVSLGVALIFIPSLAGSIRLHDRSHKRDARRGRMIVRFTNKYERVIRFIIKYRVAFIIIAVLAFGLPLFYLPDSLPADKPFSYIEQPVTKWQGIYNKILGNKAFVSDIKPVLNKALGGTLRLFSNSLKNGGNYYRRSEDVEKTQLLINIGLSEDGLTVDDINDVCYGLENMIAEYQEVDRFTTSVSSESSASMNVTFKPEHENTVFPYILKIRIEDYMNSIGSYHCYVSGVGLAFSNQVYSDYITGSYSIRMLGYNYDDLYRYAEGLKKRLISSANGRIKEVFITSGSDPWYKKKEYHNVITADREYITMAGSDMRNIYTGVNRLSRSPVYGQEVFINGFMAPLIVKSDLTEKYDMWSIENTPLKTGKALKMKDFAGVNRVMSDNTVNRENQQYVLSVTYDFIGNYELGNIILERNIDETKALLPLGYTVESKGYTYSWEVQRQNYPLIFLVLLIIFIICSILLESLRQPLTVISLIPFSFIGVFITFSLFGLTPDEGVFASMILLCGIVVNATLYILDDYNRLKRTRARLPAIKLYLKAFNGKIIPIIFTKLSTITGLLPFLFTGRDERFWFALAAGTISGLIISFIGLFLYQPLILAREMKKEIKTSKSVSDD